MRHRFLLFLGVTLGILVPSAGILLLYYHQDSKNEQSQKSPKSKKPSSFKLLKLPRVALLQVLKFLHPRDIFMLSLCSKNTSTILKAWKTKVNWLCYRGYQNELWVYNRRSFDTRDFVFSMRNVSRLDRGPENKLEIVKVTIGGMDVQCLFKDYGIDYCDTTGDTIQQAVENHIHQLFIVKYIDLEFSANNILNKIYPNISRVTDLRLYEGTISPTDFEEILETYPNLKSIRFDGQIDGPLSADSRIFNIDNVSIQKYHQSASFFWKNFKGRYATLGKGEYNETDVIDFVRSWISGIEYCNLDILFVTKNGAELDSEMILRELNTSAKEWDRPPVYEYWSRLIGTKRHRKDILRFSETDHFREYMDFERKTDQKMATLISFTIGGFGFIVWN